MTTPRVERPYVQFNFLVNLGGQGSDPHAFDGGFQEVSGIGMEVTVAEYRNGNDRENSVRKIMGLNKSTDVTLKRGCIATLTLYNWLHSIRNGTQDYRDVTIHLQSEDHNEEPVLTWTLKRARPAKTTWGPLNAKGTDVAMEEMVLAYERLELS